MQNICCINLKSIFAILDFWELPVGNDALVKKFKNSINILVVVVQSCVLLRWSLYAESREPILIPSFGMSRKGQMVRVWEISVWVRQSRSTAAFKQTKTFNDPVWQQKLLASVWCTVFQVDLNVYIDRVVDPISNSTRSFAVSKWKFFTHESLWNTCYGTF